MIDGKRFHLLWAKNVIIFQKSDEYVFSSLAWGCFSKVPMINRLERQNVVRIHDGGSILLEII